MSADALAGIVRALHQNRALPPGVHIGRDTVLLDGGLSFDSVALLELVVTLECEFGCEIDDAEITEENFATVGAAATLLAEKMVRRESA